MTTTIQKIESPVPNTKAYLLNNECTVLVSREWVEERGVKVMRYHMSIAHRSRYPTWDEIKYARYHLLPDNITMAMLLPPTDQYVNLHPNCFHLHEIDNE